MQSSYPEIKDGEFVVITLSDLLNSRKVNTEITEDDSHDVSLAEQCSCDDQSVCKNCVTPVCNDPECWCAEVDEAFAQAKENVQNALSEPECPDDCGCTDECKLGLDEPLTVDALDNVVSFICDSLDEAEQDGFFLACDQIIDTAIATYTEIAENKQGDPENRLDAADSLVSVWKTLILGTE